MSGVDKRDEYTAFRRLQHESQFHSNSCHTSNSVFRVDTFRCVTDCTDTVDYVRIAWFTVEPPSTVSADVSLPRSSKLTVTVSTLDLEKITPTASSLYISILQQYIVFAIACLYYFLFSLYSHLVWAHHDFHYCDFIRSTVCYFEFPALRFHRARPTHLHFRGGTPPQIVIC